MSIEGYNLTYQVAEVRDSFPGVPLDRHFVVIAREAFLGPGAARPHRPGLCPAARAGDGRPGDPRGRRARRRRRSRCPARRSARTSCGRSR